MFNKIIHKHNITMPTPTDCTCKIGAKLLPILSPVIVIKNPGCNEYKGYGDMYKIVWKCSHCGKIVGS